MICPKCGFELKFYEEKCPTCGNELEQEDYEQYNKKVKEESLPNISDQIKDVIGGKDETSIFRKIFLSLLILLIIISILGIIGAFVPSIGHYFTSLCEVFGKLFDSFWSLF